MIHVKYLIFEDTDLRLISHGIQVHSKKDAQSDLENFATKAQNLAQNLANLVQNGQSFIFGARHFIFVSDGAKVHVGPSKTTLLVTYDMKPPTLNTNLQILNIEQ